MLDSFFLTIKKEKYIFCIQYFLFLIIFTITIIELQYNIIVHVM